MTVNKTADERHASSKEWDVLTGIMLRKKGGLCIGPSAIQSPMRGSKRSVDAHGNARYPSCRKNRSGPVERGKV